MKIIILVACVLHFLIPGYSQIIFESGYFISNEGQRTNCQIRNMDWKDNPNRFEYRLDENSGSVEATIETIREFGVLNAATFRRFTVDIDRSTDNVERMKKERSPVFTKETLFLRVLMEGKGSLYQYRETTLDRYFYSLNQSAVQQLVYKRFLTSDGSNVATNETYKEQMMNELKCESISQKDVERTAYTREALIKFFIKYNNCHGDAGAKVEQSEKRDLFNLSLRPGLNSNSLVVKSPSETTEFDSQLSFRLGVELEFVLPSNKSTWAIIAEPTYQSFNGKGSGTSTATADYKSIELPLGVRRYFFLKDKSRLFLNASFVYDFPMNSKINSNGALDISFTLGPNAVFGLGYTRAKYIVEVRAGTGRGLLGRYFFFESRYNSLSIIVGYRLF